MIYICVYIHTHIYILIIYDRETETEKDKAKKLILIFHYNSFFSRKIFMPLKYYHLPMRPKRAVNRVFFFSEIWQMVTVILSVFSSSYILCYTPFIILEGR